MTKGTERSFSSGSAITETTNTHLRGVLERLKARRGELLGLGTDYTSLLKHTTRRVRWKDHPSLKLRRGKSGAVKPVTG